MLKFIYQMTDACLLLLKKKKLCKYKVTHKEKANNGLKVSLKSCGLLGKSEYVLDFRWYYGKIIIM